PAVAHRVLGVVPRQARLALHRVPVALQIALDRIEGLAAIGAVGVVAVLVGRVVVVPVVLVGVVRTGVVVLLPVRGVLGRIDHLGQAVAGLRAGHRTGDRAHDRAGRAADRRADGRTREGAGACAGTGTDGMILL